MFQIEFVEIPQFRRECFLLLLGNAAGLQPDTLLVPILFAAYIPQFPHPFCVSAQRLFHTQTRPNAQSNLRIIPNLQPAANSSAVVGHSVRPGKMGCLHPQRLCCRTASQLHRRGSRGRQ